MTNFYKRITGSEIQGNVSTVVQPAGTITVDSNTNTLKLHDGSTPGGNSIGGGSLGGFAAYYNSLYTTNADDLYIAPLWDSGPGPAYLKLPGYPNSTGNAVVLSNYQEGGAGVSIISSNPRNGNTEHVWNFGSNGELSLPTGGNIGATKGGTMLDGGFGYGTSVTSYYPSGMYSSCVTANPGGTLSISTYGDGTGSSGQWIFGSNTVTIPGTIITQYGNIESGTIGPGITIMANVDAGQYFNGLFVGNTTNRRQHYVEVDQEEVLLGVTNLGTNQTYQWTFSADGNLTLPAGGVVNSAGGTGPVAVQSNDGSTTYTWTFGTDGKLTLPTDGSIDTYSGTGGFKITTDGQIQFASGYSIGGSDTGLGLRMATDRGTILFGNHPEPGTTTHFHIMKQDPYHVDLFLGDDNNYVKLPNTGGVEIATAGNSQNTWTFGVNGSLQFPQGGTLKVGTVPTQSTGTPGDTAGTVAFGDGYIYYCIADYTVDTVVAYTGSLEDNFDGYSTYGFNKIATDITGWTLTVPGQSASVTVTAVDQSLNNGVQTGLQFSGAVTYTLTETFTFTAPSVTNIWKRIAWSGDTW